jgi:hypothetical protein
MEKQFHPIGQHNRKREQYSAHQSQQEFYPDLHGQAL